MARTLTVSILGNKFNKDYKVRSTLQNIGPAAFLFDGLPQLFIIGHVFTIMLDGSAVGQIQDTGRTENFQIQINDGPHRVWIRMNGKDYPALDIPAGSFSCQVFASENEALGGKNLRLEPYDGYFPVDLENSDTVQMILSILQNGFAREGVYCQKLRDNQICDCCVIAVASDRVNLSFYRRIPTPPNNSAQSHTFLIHWPWGAYGDFQEASDLSTSYIYTRIGYPGSRVPFNKLEPKDRVALRNRIKNALSSYSHLTLQGILRDSPYAETYLQIINNISSDGSIRPCSADILMEYARTFW